jgi:hypothetical protein
VYAERIRNIAITIITLQTDEVDDASIKVSHARETMLRYETSPISQISSIHNSIQTSSVSSMDSSVNEDGSEDEV